MLLCLHDFSSPASATYESTYIHTHIHTYIQQAILVVILLDEILGVAQGWLGRFGESGECTGDAFERYVKGCVFLPYIFGFAREFWKPNVAW